MLCAVSLAGQDRTETIFSNSSEYGGFGGPIVEFSNINGTTVGDVGGGGGLVIDHFFFGGYGLGNDAAQVDVDENTYDIHFRHGGFWLGYSFAQHKAIHAYGSFRIGWGEASLKQNDVKSFENNLLAIAPELGIEMNITNWFKLGLTGGYRAVSGIDTLPELTNDDFTGMYGALTFRFGGFGDYESYNDVDIDFD